MFTPWQATLAKRLASAEKPPARKVMIQQVQLGDSMHACMHACIRTALQRTRHLVRDEEHTAGASACIMRLIRWAFIPWDPNAFVLHRAPGGAHESQGLWEIAPDQNSKLTESQGVRRKSMARGLYTRQMVSPSRLGGFVDNR